MTPSDPRAAALADLRRAITGLFKHMNGPEDWAEFALLQAATERLAADQLPPEPGMRDFDPTRFQHLLDLAGPGMAGTLLTHLAADLTRCQTLISDGASNHDWAALREGSHILISLAGSAGAQSLQAMTEALNTAVHALDVTTIGSIYPSLNAELEALIALVRASSAAQGAPG